MAALVFVLTRIPQIPIPATGGYVHLGDAGITFAACAFGPWIAMLAGGIGTALADLSSGFAQWAIFSFLVHGAQGWVMGLITRKSHDVRMTVLAVIVGMGVLVAGYFVAGIILMGVGAALGEILPNIIQGLSGGIVGLPLYFAVRKAYPPLTQYTDF
jgi:uncharacterized membrane protein